MIAYHPPAYRPRMAQIVGPGDAPLGPLVTTAPAAGPSLPEGLLWTALAGAASWAAIQTGRNTKGFKSVAAWAGGVAAGLAALTGLAGVVAPKAARGFPIRWYFNA